MFSRIARDMYGSSGPRIVSTDDRLLDAALTDSDRQSVRKHLGACELSERRADRLLASILRRKIVQAHSVGPVVPEGLAVIGSMVRFRIEGREPESGVLQDTAVVDPAERVIPVASLLGATLLGLRVSQRAPLLREDGSVSTLVLLDVTGPEPRARLRPVRPS